MNESLIESRINEAQKYISCSFSLSTSGVFKIEDGKKESDPPVFVFLSAPVWVRSYSVNDLGQWTARIEFIDRSGNPQAHHVSVSRLYMNAAALAAELGGLGLRLEAARASSLSAYLSSFTSPVAERDQKKSEQEQIIDNVREFILRNEDRFQYGEAFPVRSRAGYRYKEDDWWAFTSTALLEASGCHSATKVARVLLKAGLLVKNDSNNNMKCPLADGRRVRMYVVAGHILESDTPTLSALLSTPPPLPEIETRAAETRNLEPSALAALIDEQSQELGQENIANSIVTSINDVVIIESTYQPDIHELDAATSLMRPPASLEIEEYDHENHDENISHAYAACAAEHGIEVRH